MGKNIAQICLEKGILLDKELFDVIDGIDDQDSVIQIIDRISGLFKEKIVTKTLFIKNIEQLQSVYSDDQKKVLNHILVHLGITIDIKHEIPAPKEEKRILEGIKVLSSTTLPAKKLEVDNFVKYFRSRFQEIRGFLQTRNELQNLISINKISNNKTCSLIGIVMSKRITKNKNLLIEVEDLTGRITLLVNRNREEVYALAKDIMLDDIIGVRGNGNGDLFFANDIVYPDAFLPEKHLFDKDEYVAFTSDVHIGSKMFLKQQFLKFIDWLNGKVGDEVQQEIARRVKWLFITGDTIDGVGVYPGQENLLDIKDVREQYRELAKILSTLRKDITIIMCPGQHDAVRVAEPQPPVGRDYGEPLFELENLVLVSNPAMIEILNQGKPGVKILMYHGASMHSFISEIEELRIGKAHQTPAKVIKHLLKRRHLAPTHSSVTYIPGDQDSLVIREVPDIITTGDLHKPDIDYYNNIMIIASSCWQSITPFEEKVGNVPDPCKVPLLNLRTRALKVMDFSDVSEEGKKD